MITIYVKPFCSFCERVLRFIDLNNCNVELKDITNKELAVELIEHGGKRQVPYLIDSDTKISMYESRDIIDYLKTHYVR